MKKSAEQHRTLRSTLVTIVGVLVFAAWSGLASQALAQGRGNSGLPFAPGNPLADLQRQIDELKAMVSGPGEFQTVVNCAEGKKVQDALDGAPKGASRVIITINGVCLESVAIDRDDVVLQGASQDSGLQQGTTAAAPTLWLKGAQRVEINNLTITGGNRGMVVHNGSSFRSQSLIVRNTGQYGINMSRNSAGILWDLYVEGDSQQSGSQYGIFIFRGAEITVTGGRISGHAHFGVQNDGSQVTLDGVEVSNNGNGAMTSNGGALRLVGGTRVEHSSRAGIIIGNGSSVSISGPGTKIANSGEWGVNLGTSSALTMERGAIVENNQNGLLIGGSSSAFILDAGEIRNNSINGINILDTSTANFGSREGAPKITGNGQIGIFCQGTPAVAQYSGDPEISGNGTATNCPGH
jgi:hypothetical protein